MQKSIVLEVLFGLFEALREKTILQGLGYMMGFEVPVSERNGHFS